MDPLPRDFRPDKHILSTNAITEDGILVNIDGNANRVSAIAYGPKKLVMIVGMNKVCCDVDGAMKRARNMGMKKKKQARAQQTQDLHDEHYKA